MGQFQSTILELIKFQIQSKKELQERQIKNEEKFQQQILELKQDNDKKQLEISELIHKAILTKKTSLTKNSARKIQFGPPLKLSTTIPRKIKLLNASTKSTKISFDINCQTWTDEEKKLDSYSQNLGLTNIISSPTSFDSRKREI